MLTILKSLFVAIIYGFMENRLFKELNIRSEDNWLFNHFKTYHIFMGLMFLVIAFNINIRIWLLNCVLMPFIQDFSWILFERRKPRRDDWSNWLPFYRNKPPLIAGLFIWYWISIITIIILLISLWG